MIRKRTAIYIRYSSSKQAKRGGVSLAVQLADLRRVTEANNEEVVAELVDQAKTATTMNKREAFQELMRLARAGEVDRVRAEAVDRTNRNELDRRTMERELEKYGVELIYLGETADQSPEQLVLSRGIRGTVAEYESLQTSQRVYSRMKYRAEQGKWRGGHINYGLQPDGNGWFVPDPDTYPVLMHILNRLAEGWGRYRICKELNRGISIDGKPPEVPPTPGLLEYRQKPYIERMDPETGDTVREPKREPSQYWGISTIAKLLNQAVNGVYAGVYEWGRDHYRRKLHRDKQGRPKQSVVYQHDPLIPEELIAKLRRIRAESSKRHGGRVSTYLLRPTCGKCGGPMNGGGYRYKDRVKRYYVCVHAKMSGGNSLCEYWSANADVVERQVLQTVAEQFKRINPEKIQEQFETVIKSEIARLKTEIGELDLRIQEGTRMKDNALRYLLSFGTTLGDELRRELEYKVNDAIKELEQRTKERAAAELALTELRRHPRIVETMGTVDLSAIETVKAALDNREDVEYDPLRRALQLLVKEVRLTPGDIRLRRAKAADGVKVEVELREWEKELWSDVLRRPRLYGLDLSDDEGEELGGTRADEKWPEDI